MPICHDKSNNKGKRIIKDIWIICLVSNSATHPFIKYISSKYSILIESFSSQLKLFLLFIFWNFVILFYLYYFRYKLSNLLKNPFLASLKALKFVFLRVCSISAEVYPSAKNVAIIAPADVPANLYNYFNTYILIIKNYI